LKFEQSREGFHSLEERIRDFVPMTQVIIVMEATGHYHKNLVQFLQEFDIPVYLAHPQKRQDGLIKSDKRDALALATRLYYDIEKGVQSIDPMQAIRRVAAPSAAVSQCQGMVYRREELVRDRTRRLNKLTAICDEVFPELTQIYKDPNSESSLALRQAFPTPVAVCGAGLSELAATRTARRPTEDQLTELQRLAAKTIGTKDPIRLDWLILDQQQLITELDMINRNVETLETKISQVIANSREGQILTSIPGIGPMHAAAILAVICNIANFGRPAQLKSYCGWAPKISQSGRTLDNAKLSPRGVRLMKKTLFLVVLQIIHQSNSEFADLYKRLVPHKCMYDKGTNQHRGKSKVIGRVAGHVITVIFTLLKRDQELIAQAHGGPLPNPELYDREIHHRHRVGQYSPRVQTEPSTLVHSPAV
jgi:transposase